MRIAILTGNDSAATRLCVSQLVKIPGVEIAGILLDIGRRSLARRTRNLVRSVRRRGWSHLWFRCGEFLNELLFAWAGGIVSENEVDRVLRRAFPGRAFSLEDFRLPVYRVNNLNSSAAADCLRELSADLGVVLGTRVLKRSTFSVPRMGCINLHKGKVPEFRGMPPGFWELYEGCETAGVTVHFIDHGLDTGDVVGADEVPIHRRDTPSTLRKKLDHKGSELLCRCVSALASGRVERQPQEGSSTKVRTAPQQQERAHLAERLGYPLPNAWRSIRKTLFYLAIYHSRLYLLSRVIHPQACILLYHRVNDLAEDSLTTDVHRFAEHLVMLRKHHGILSSAELIELIQSGRKLPRRSVIIHFDDCYRDVATNAAPLLAKMGFSATAFISSGFIDTDRVFEHDAAKCPFRVENLRASDVSSLLDHGFDIGSHTVNHVDLGSCSIDDAVIEVKQSKRDLETLSGKQISLFSFPFGRPHNIRPEVLERVRQAGYRAVFSAYGGYVTRKANVYNLRRVGASGEFTPLELLLQVEGLTLGAIKLAWNTWRKPPWIETNGVKCFR